MKIEIQKEKRKTISLRMLDSEHCVLKAPTNMSEKDINAFIESKNSWLMKHSQMMKQKESVSTEFDLLNYVYYKGQKLQRVEDIVLGCSHLSEAAKVKAIKKYYLSMFENLEMMLKELATQYNLPFNDVKPVDSVRVWGSYNSKRLVKLNWKLLILPEELSRYVICHELCHSKHMNHKPQFWADVEKMCPNYKVLRKQLEGYSFLLKNTEI